MDYDFKNLPQKPQIIRLDGNQPFKYAVKPPKKENLQIERVKPSK